MCTCVALLASRQSAGAIASTKLRLRASGCPQLARSAATLVINLLRSSPRRPAMHSLPHLRLCGANTRAVRAWSGLVFTMEPNAQS